MRVEKGTRRGWEERGWAGWVHCRDRIGKGGRGEDRSPLVQEDEGYRERRETGGPDVELEMK